jgi:hypothetical protein
MYLLDIVKANAEIGKLNESVKAATAEKETLVKSIAEFETQIKQHIETSQTIAQLKDTHAAELTKLKADYEAKLAEASKTIETTKASVVDESIKLVASQGTNQAIEAVAPVGKLTAEMAYNTYKSLSGEERKQYFANNNALITSFKAGKGSNK